MSRRRRTAGAAAHRELALFVSPLAKVAAGVWRGMPFWILAVALLYGASGIAIVDADEVAIVLRWGAVTRSAGQPAVHPPGFLWALPRPFEEVIKIRVDRIETIEIDELAAPMEGQERARLEGYMLTGDRNILHTRIRARYRIAEPVSYALLTLAPAELLRATLLESTIKIAGATPLDDLFSHGRGQFTRQVAAEVEARLQRVGGGLEIVSVEFEMLGPPDPVADDFEAVQSAYIEAQTRMQEANAYVAERIPAARTEARMRLAGAEAEAVGRLSRARAETGAFKALLPLQQTDPPLLRQRLYRESIEATLRAVEDLRFVPAPVSNGYGGARFTVNPAAHGRPARIDGDGS